MNVCLECDHYVISYSDWGDVKRNTPPTFDIEKSYCLTGEKAFHPLYGLHYVQRICIEQNEDGECMFFKHTSPNTQAKKPPWWKFFRK